MKTWAKIAVAALLAVAVAILLIRTASAQTPDPAGAVDPMCDHCADFTDAATSAGKVRSSYKPVEGYAATPENQATTVAAEPRKDADHRMQMFRVEKK